MPRYHHRIAKLPPRWSQYRKLNDKSRQALQEAIEKAIKESSENAVHIFLQQYIRVDWRSQ